MLMEDVPALEHGATLLALEVVVDGMQMLLKLVHAAESVLAEVARVR